MIVTKQENGDTLTIAVEGRLNTQTANDFGNEVKTAIASATNVIFDFDKLEYISSTGLRVLLFAQKEMNKRGSMKIINVSEEVYEILQAVGFTGVSDIYMKE